MMDIFKSTKYHLHESLTNVLEVTQYFYIPLPHSTVPELFRPRQSAWMCQLIRLELQNLILSTVAHVYNPGTGRLRRITSQAASLGQQSETLFTTNE